MISEVYSVLFIYTLNKTLLIYCSEELNYHLGKHQIDLIYITIRKSDIQALKPPFGPNQLHIPT